MSTPPDRTPAEQAVAANARDRIDQARADAAGVQLHPLQAAYAAHQAQRAAERKAANDNALTDEQAKQAREAFATYQTTRRANPFAAARYYPQHAWFIEHGRRLSAEDDAE